MTETSTPWPNLPPNLVTFASALAGAFENRQQAMAEPARFVRLRVWQRPVFPRGFGGLAAEPTTRLMLFVEQVNVQSGQPPYRQRVMQLTAAPDLQVQYYALKHPADWVGASQETARLGQLSAQDLVKLPGCSLTVSQPGPGRFCARLPPETRCGFEYQGKTRYVDLKFDLTIQSPGATVLFSADTGIDPDSGKALWGALWGPFELVKDQDFSPEWEGATSRRLFQTES